MNWLLRHSIYLFRTNKKEEKITALLTEKEDDLAVEIPVSLVYNGISHAVMMCSPKNLEDFALGFSLTEGIIDKPSDIYGISKLLHLAQRFSRSALLGFLLVAPLARAVDRIVNAHGKLESLVVVGSCFRQKLVGDLAVDVLLHDFLQGRLVIFHVLAAVDGQKLIV